MGSNTLPRTLCTYRGQLSLPLGRPGPTTLYLHSLPPTRLAMNVPLSMNTRKTWHTRTPYSIILWMIRLSLPPLILLLLTTHLNPLYHPYHVCGWEYTNTQKIYQWPVQLILRWYWYYFCVLKAVSMNRKHLYSFLLLCTLSFKFQSPASQTKWSYSMILEKNFSQPMFF